MNTDQTDPRGNERLETPPSAAAQHAAEWGSVFPLRPGRKVPLHSDWQKEATTDRTDIDRLWKQNPTANVGIRTGNGLLVLDIDVKGEDGFASLDRIVADGYELPRTLAVRTPSGGEHRYFRVQTDQRNRVGFLPGLDIRCAGGLVVAAGSVLGEEEPHPGRYEVLENLEIGDWPIPESQIEVWKHATREEKSTELGITDERHTWGAAYHRALANAGIVRTLESAPGRNWTMYTRPGRHDGLAQFLGWVRNRWYWSEDAWVRFCEAASDLLTSPSHRNDDAEDFEVLVRDAWGWADPPPSWDELVEQAERERGQTGTDAHWLEREDVVRVLGSIRAGMDQVELERTLRELPPVPSDELTALLIRDRLAAQLKQAGHSVRIADAFIRTAPRVAIEHEYAEVAERLATCDPWPESVDGLELIEEARSALQRFVFVPDDYVYDVLAAWVVHTFIYDQFPTTAYLHVTAPSLMSGKTRLLEILEEFSRRALFAGGLSAAVLYRAVEAFKPTLLIDEVDTIFKFNSDSSEAVRQVLNNGYTRDKPILRMDPQPDGSMSPATYDPYCPKALAGIGRIPDTIASRSIEIRMVRKKRGEEAERYARRQREQLRLQATEWKRKAERWVSDNADGFDLEPQFPEGMSDRTQDCWEPLFVVGEMIGADWPSRLRTAAVALTTREGQHGANDLGGMLLEDLQDLFEEEPIASATHLGTDTLLARLSSLEERPWPHLRNGQGLNAKKLADLLREFGVRPGRFDHNTKRGYATADIREAIDRWSR
ncbi:MAG: DUF3631 domain-containing protein [Actinomycetota bacterium]